MNGITPLSAEYELTEMRTTYDLLALKSGGYMWIGSADDGSYSGVFGQLLDKNGEQTGGMFQINSSTFSNQWDANATILENGRIMVVWESYHDHASTGQRSEVMGQVLKQNGAKVGAEFQVNSYIGDEQNHPEIVALDGGGAAVFWENTKNTATGGGYDIYAKFLDNSGAGPDEDQILAETPSFVNAAPSVVALSNGKVAAVWQGVVDNTNSKFDILFGLVTAGQTTPPVPIVVNQTTENSQSTPSIGVLENGNFAIAWHTFIDGKAAVVGRIFKANGTPKTDEFVIDDEGPRDPEIHPTPDGGFIVTFQEYFSRINPNENAVLARRFDKTGDAIGSWETLQENATSASEPHISIQANGDFLALWGNGDAGVSVSRLFQAETWGTSGKDTLTGTEEADVIYGRGRADTLRGVDGNDVLDGGSGNDTVEGGSGKDKLFGQTGDDILSGGRGKDKLKGGNDDDTLRGGSGNDTLEGGKGSDTLDGGSGRDTLKGGKGTNTLTGGADKDTFVFANSDGKTFITDFEEKDRLLLDDKLWKKTLSVTKVLNKYADDSGPDTFLKFADGEKVVLRGVDDAATLLDQIDFI